MKSSAALFLSIAVVFGVLGYALGLVAMNSNLDQDRRLRHDECVFHAYVHATPVSRCRGVGR